MKILITGGKSAIAMKLVKGFTGATVILGDYGDVPSLKTVAYSFEDLGAWNEDVLAHNLLTKALDLGVDTILPLYKSEIVAVCNSLVLFEEFGINVLASKENKISSEILPKGNDWAILDKGKLIYTTVDSEEIFANANSLNLTGAFWCSAAVSDFNSIFIDKQ